MEEYITLGHMRELDEGKINKDSEKLCYYIPHHAVLKETSTSTKLRAVFDASMPTTSGLSLNQCLMVGPVVQSDLISVIMRFRVHKIVFTADITKMYRQVLLHPDDTCFQRIFWRSNFNDPIKTYELTTVAFGTASAPFLATRCLIALAEFCGNKFPITKSVLKRDFYVDDVLTGADTIEKASEIQQQLQQILVGGGFKLSKWCSNSKELLSEIPENERENSFPFSLDKNEKVIKTLGMLWFPN